LYHDDASRAAAPVDGHFRPSQQVNRLRKRTYSDEFEHYESSDSASAQEDAIEVFKDEGDIARKGLAKAGVLEGAVSRLVAGFPTLSAPNSLFSPAETAFLFDWDDTILPSTWLESQHLRLDDACEVSAWQKAQLDKVAEIASETLRIAKRLGIVVLITNAERGWIELSCKKFLPMLCTCLENVKIVSARTTYEGPQNTTPFDWKLRAFEHELLRIFGTDTLRDAQKQKNLLSLGDGTHEREALWCVTKELPSCRSKSVMFLERPDISHIVQQHSLIKSRCERIIQHDGNLDLCIKWRYRDGNRGSRRREPFLASALGPKG
jgi:hypothetical protein